MFLETRSLLARQYSMSRDTVGAMQAAAEQTEKLAATARSANADVQSLLDRVIGLESRHELERSSLADLSGEINGQLDRIDAANATLTRVTSVRAGRSSPSPPRRRNICHSFRRPPHKIPIRAKPPIFLN